MNWLRSTAIQPLTVTSRLVMDKVAKIYVAGHEGMVGSAIERQLCAAGYTNLVSRTHA